MSMLGNEISVTDTSIGGKFTGRDDNSLNINTVAVRNEYLQDLYERFNKEKETNQDLVELCQELDYYNSKIDGDLIGLDEKLKDGNREKIIFYAKSAKEKFHKKLMTTSQYSYVAQNINIWLLAKVKRSFMMEIYSLICNEESEEKINFLITERIINPVKLELGINLFKYDEEDIMGMIFFLTGNCHLKWC